MQAHCEGEEYAQLVERWMGVGEQVLTTEGEEVGIDGDCVLKLFQRWGHMEDGGVWHWQRSTQEIIKLQLEKKELDSMSPEVTREFLDMVLGLHAFHRFTVATATDGSLKEEMGPDGVMIRKVAWGATEGKGCLSGGSLPSWMEIMDAELEAIFQVLVSKGDGERVLFLVDCRPALDKIEWALHQESFMVEGKGREMVLRRIVQEINRMERVVFLWVPSHVGCIPNSYADCVAKACLKASATAGVSCCTDKGLKAGWMVRKTGGPLLKGTFKSAMKDSQKAIMGKLMQSSTGTWLDRKLISTGEVGLSSYWTKLLTHTSMPRGQGEYDSGTASMGIVDFNRQMRSRRVGAMHDRHWEVAAKEGTEFHDFWNRQTCPCGEGHATVQHIMFKCKLVGQEGLNHRSKAAGFMVACMDMVQNDQSAARPNAGPTARDYMGEVVDRLQGGDGIGVGEEECMKAMCGVLPRPVEVDKFKDFMVPYIKCLQHLKWLLETYRQFSKPEHDRLQAIYTFRWLLRGIFKAWRLRLTISYMLGNVLDIDYSDDEHATNSEVTEWWHDWQPIDTNLESSDEINASSRVRPRANDTDPRGSNDSNDNHNEEGGGGTRPNRGRGKRRKLARPFMGHRAHARFSASFQHRDVHPGIFVGGLHPPNDRPPPH